VTQVAVADTHAVWFYLERNWRKFGARARQIFEQADEGQAAIFIPTLVLVELAEGCRSGHLELQGGFSTWLEGIRSSSSFVPVDLTVDIVLRAEELYAIPERGDRLIAATAAHLDCPLITRDQEIEAAAGVRVIW
jgi:PIN domain nuclease of toxin-antitoxin system